MQHAAGGSFVNVSPASVPPEPEPDWREKKRRRIAARAARIAARQANGVAAEAKKQSRAERRAGRAARVEKRRLESLAMGGERPAVANVPLVADPLRVYGRDGLTQTDALRGLWQNCAAFYVCGGPSLKQIDLSFLRDRGVVSLGINNVAAYAHVRAWAFSDPAEKFHHGIFFDPTILKFVPRPKLGNRVRAKLDGRFHWTAYEVRQCPSVFSFDREGHLEPETFLTTEYASWGRSEKHKTYPKETCQLFTFFIGLRLLHYLGARRVYLLGVDFKMGGSAGFYAFGSDRHDGAASCNNGQYAKASRMLANLRPVFERAGFEVYQTNKDSGLTVFDYVPLETAVADCKSALPPEPYDVDRYYDKLKDAGQSATPETDDRGED